jgi:uncharacterized RDD family membrane protein YckC
VTTDDSYYDLLGVAPDAPKDEIRAAYQDKLATVRAGRTREEATRRPSDDVIRAARDEEARLRSAWQVLSDPVQRQRYDDQFAPDGADEPEPEDGEPEDEAAEAPTPPPRDPVGSLVTAQGLEIPTLGRRLTAAGIDIVTLLALWSAIVYPVTLGVGASRGFPAFITEVGTMEFLILAYLVFPTWWVGQTLGKRYTYCMVVDRATGQLPTLGQTIIRYLIPAFAFALLLTTGGIIAVFYALSFIMSRDQVSLADRLAKTAVVIARYRPERSA